MHAKNKNYNNANNNNNYMYYYYNYYSNNNDDNNEDDVTYITEAANVLQITELLYKSQQIIPYLQHSMQLA